MWQSQSRGGCGIKARYRRVSFHTLFDTLVLSRHTTALADCGAGSNTNHVATPVRSLHGWARLDRRQRSVVQPDQPQLTAHVPMHSALIISWSLADSCGFGLAKAYCVLRVGNMLSCL